jgi:hypothetical protein
VGEAREVRVGGEGGDGGSRKGAKDRQEDEKFSNQGKCTSVRMLTHGGSAGKACGGGGVGGGVAIVPCIVP